MGGEPGTGGNGGTTSGGSTEGGVGSDSSSIGGMGPTSCPPHTACPLAECLPGYADCDGNVIDGCEIEIDNSADNCGSCGHQCVRGAVPGECVAGECVFEDGGGAAGAAGEGGAG
jgi:hypothetical protein